MILHSRRNSNRKHVCVKIYVLRRYSRGRELVHVFCRCFLQLSSQHSASGRHNWPFLTSPRPRQPLSVCSPSLTASQPLTLQTLQVSPAHIWGLLSYLLCTCACDGKYCRSAGLHDLPCRPARPYQSGQGRPPKHQPCHDKCIPVYDRACKASSGTPLHFRPGLAAATLCS